MPRRTIRALPAWFEWNNYQRLSNLRDRAEWAWLFASRDPTVKEEIQRGLGILSVFDPRRPHTRTAWRDGVLCYGIKGHSTNEYLTNLVNQVRESESTGFISEDEFRALQAMGQLHKRGNHFRSFRGGYMTFANEQSLRTYEQAEKAAFSRTVEFAVNLRMPKKRLLEEIENIIDEEQRRFIAQKLLVKIPRANARNWCRGLAVVDLLSDGLLQADIARLLVPRWFNRHAGPKTDDIDKKEVRSALQTVRPYIEGGWRTLCGDPVVSERSSLLRTV